MPTRTKDTESRPPRPEDGKAARRPPEDRVQFALACRQRGLNYTATLAAITEKYGINRRTAAFDIAELRRRIREDLDHRLPHIAVQEAERLERVASAAEADGDYLAAIAASDKLLKLAGAYAPTKIEVETRPSQEQLDEIRAELQVKYVMEADSALLIRVLEGRGYRVDVTDAEVVQ